MKLGSIDFPDALFQAIRDDRLVIFAGAGVSMGDPAKLPSFSELAKLISDGTGKTKEENESEDQFLGGLFDSGTNVHQIASEHLKKDKNVFNQIQSDLLRVFVESNRVKLVTTNFDELFESATKKLWNQIPEVFRAPALPLGRNFLGIVHLHGVLSHWNEMVLTDRDFGRAYLTEGWARRFLLDLFNNQTVLFVGYSHNDADLQYLARSLPPQPLQQKNRFVLTPEGQNDKWERLGIEPVSYPNSSGDHSGLEEGIKKLADFVRMDIEDWKKFISRIAAQNPNDLNIEDEGSLRHALRESVSHVRFFVGTATNTEWLEWLRNNKFLDDLFDNSQMGLNEKSRYFADWIVKQTVSQNPEKVLLFFGKWRNSMNPTFWQWLSMHVTSSTSSMDKPIFEKWVIFLLDRYPQIFDEGDSFYKLGKKAESQKSFNLLPIIFEKMISTKLVIKEPLIRTSVDEDDEKSDVDQIFQVVHQNIKKFWDECLLIHLNQFATDVLSICVGFLDRRYEIFAIWREGKGGWDRDGLGRSAIEPNSQDLYPEPIDVVIDAIRDSLTELLKTEPDSGKFWCDHLIKRNSPVLKRIAIHSVRIASNWPSVEKMDWILKTDINDFQAWHEIFIFMKDVYPGTTEKQRNRLIKKIEEYKAWNNDEDAAKQKVYFDLHCLAWLSMLNTADPHFKPASEKLSQLKELYPNWLPGEHPDFLHSHGETVFREVQSPWTAEQLLADNASNWLNKLLEYKPQRIFDADRRILLNSVMEAAKRDLKWANELADELAKGNHWSSDLWDALFKSWQFWPDDPGEASKVFKWLGSEHLLLDHGKNIAETLNSLVKDGGKKYAKEFLKQTNEIGLQLWPKLVRTEISDEIRKNWLTNSLLNAAGALAQYFLRALFLEREGQTGGMPEFYRKTFELMMADRTSAGAFARTFISSQYAFLLEVDEAWTMENVHPLFMSDEPDDFSQAWRGFLTWTNLSPKVGITMSDAFLRAIPKLSKELVHVREQFVRYYTYMMLLYVENPLENWIPIFFNKANLQDKLNFAEDIRKFFESENPSNVQKKSAWDNWVGKYWKNRIVGTPASLEGQEVGIMLSWFPYIGFAWPKALDLLVDMQPSSFERTRLLFELNDSPLVDSFPNETAKILIFFLSCKCEHFNSSQIKPIIERLNGKIPDVQLKESLNKALLKIGNDLKV